MTAAQHRGLLTCSSGARELGLWVYRLPRELGGNGHRDKSVHITCTRAHPNLDERVRRHRHTGTATGPHPWVAEPSVLVAQAFRCLPELEAFVIAESALCGGLVSLASLQAALQGNRNAKHLELLQYLDTRAQSLLETIIRFPLLKRGHVVQPQGYVPEIGHVDMIVDDCAAVELHGKQYHLEADQWRRDLRRSNAATFRQLPMLQFDSDRVLQDPFGVVAEIERFVDQVRRRR